MNRGPGRGPAHEEIRLFQEIGRRLDRRGFLAANDGNLSLRREDGTYLVTATGARKGYLRPEEVVAVDAAGRLLQGARQPSSELEMHLAVYRVRPEARAVVHAHPPIATAFAVARQPMDACVLPEVILTLGSVPIAPYATPGTPDLARSIEGAVRDHDAVLLANHGAITLGPGLEDAYFTMERVEHSAHILFAARLLGHVETLPAPDIRRLMRTGPIETRDRIPCVPGPGPGELGETESPSLRSPPGGADTWDQEQLVRLITEVLQTRGETTGGKE